MNHDHAQAPSEMPENWTPTEEMLRQTLALSSDGRNRDATRYQWLIGGIAAALALVVGMYIQSERYTKTIFVIDARVTVLEKQFGNMEIKLDRIIENMVTKDDIRKP